MYLGLYLALKKEYKRTQSYKLLYTRHSQFSEHGNFKIMHIRFIVEKWNNCHNIFHEITCNIFQAVRVSFEELVPNSTDLQVEHEFEN
jgi:hypothetical protein